MSLALTRIWQNIYRDGQEALRDPAFLPNDGRRNARTHYRELGLFLRFYHAGRHEEAEYTGIFSPRFGAKTRLGGADLHRFIAAHPGQDVYFVNPFPQNGYYSFNVWAHGEYSHPGIVRLAQALFDRAGIGFDLASMGRNAPDTLLYSNYWVGNQRFWDRFMDLNVRLLDALDSLPEAERAGYFALDPAYHEPVPVLPFIFERLFSTLLLMDPSIRALGWRHGRAELLRAAAEGPTDLRIVVAFADVVEEIDRRGVYDARDRAIFRAIMQLKEAAAPRARPERRER